MGSSPIMGTSRIVCKKIAGTCLRKCVLVADISCERYHDIMLALLSQPRVPMSGLVAPRQQSNIYLSSQVAMVDNDVALIM